MSYEIGQVKNSEPTVVRPRQRKRLLRLLPWPRIYVPKVLIFSLFGLLISFFGINIGRQFLDGMLVRYDQSLPVHKDSSEFGRTAKPEIPPSVKIALRYESGDLVEVLVNQDALSKFTKEAFTKLEDEKRAALANVPQWVASAIDPLRDQTIERIAAYADWYYAWRTGYAILGESIKSTISHAAYLAEPTKISDMVSADVGAYILERYREMVLYPEVMNFRIEGAVKQARDAAHSEYLRSVSGFERDFQDFLGTHTTHLSASGGLEPVIVPDWQSQTRKIRLSSVQRGGFDEFARLAALTTSSGVIGGSIGKVVAAKLGLKLAAPFVAKAIETGGTGIAAGSVGTFFGGPIGFIAGAVAGVATDYLVSKAIEYEERDVFERDAREAVEATYNEWKANIVGAIDADVSVWYDDTVQATTAYTSPVHR